MFVLLMCLSMTSVTDAYTCTDCAEGTTGVCKQTATNICLKPASGSACPEGFAVCPSPEKKQPQVSSVKGTVTIQTKVRSARSRTTARLHLRVYRAWLTFATDSSWPCNCGRCSDWHCEQQDAGLFADVEGVQLDMLAMPFFSLSSFFFSFLFPSLFPFPILSSRTTLWFTLTPKVETELSDWVHLPTRWR